jgi:E3 ubiquitin-protein ligase RNF14
VIFLEIPVHLPEEYISVMLTAEETSTYAAVASTPIQTVEYKLSNLPPILLQVTLPSDYPLQSAPQILSLHATHSWLPRQRALIDALLSMWQAGEGVLYSWIEHIESGRFLEGLGLSENGHTIRYVFPLYMV